MTKREKLTLGLFISIAIGTMIAQVASVAHMIEAYGWANSPEMAIFLAAVTVIMSGVFVALAVITPDGRSRIAIMVGTALLFLAEWAGNVGIGGLLVKERMPAGIATFFGLEAFATQRAAAFLFSGFLPVLVFIAVYAITESAKKLLEEPPVDAYAEQVLHGLETEWASAVQQAEQIATLRNNGATQMKGAKQ